MNSSSRLFFPGTERRTDHYHMVGMRLDLAPLCHQVFQPNQAKSFRICFNWFLEQFHQSCSDVLKSGTAVFLVFGFVSASVIPMSGLPRRCLAKNQKSSLLIATSFLPML
jgi:hypothetical protein